MLQANISIWKLVCVKYWSTIYFRCLFFDIPNNKKWLATKMFAPSKLLALIYFYLKDVYCVCWVRLASSIISLFFPLKGWGKCFIFNSLYWTVSTLIHYKRQKNHNCAIHWHKMMKLFVTISSLNQMNEQQTDIEGLLGFCWTEIKGN